MRNKPNRCQTVRIASKNANPVWVKLLAIASPFFYTHAAAQVDPTLESYERTLSARSEAKQFVESSATELRELLAFVAQETQIEGIEALAALSAEDRAFIIGHVLELIKASGRHRVDEVTIEAYEILDGLADTLRIIEEAPLGLARPEFARRMTYGRALQATGEAERAQQVAISALDAYEARLENILGNNNLSLKSGARPRNGYYLIRLLERDACSREFHDFCISIAQRLLFEDCEELQQYRLSLLPSEFEIDIPEDTSLTTEECFPTTTPYQDPNTQALYTEILSVLSESATQLDFEIPSDIAIAALPEHSINAEAIVSRNIITLNTELTRVITNAMTLLDSFEKEDVIRYRPDGGVELYLPPSGEIQGRILALWLAFLGDENIRPDRIGQPSVASLTMVRSIEVYVVAHELGHLVLEHSHANTSLQRQIDCLPSPAEYPARVLAAEIQADLFAFEVLENLEGDEFRRLFFDAIDADAARDLLYAGYYLYFVTQGTLQGLREIVAGRYPELADSQPSYQQIVSDFVTCIREGTCSVRLPPTFESAGPTTLSHPAPGDRLSIAVAFRAARSGLEAASRVDNPRVNAFAAIAGVTLNSLWENSTSVRAYSTLRGESCIQQQ